MPLHQAAGTVGVGGTREFDFGGAIVAYMIGMSHFDFRFPGDNSNQIQELSLSLTGDLPNAAAGRLTVTVDGIMRDGDNHSLDPSQSNVTVAVLAWLEDDSFVTLGNSLAIPAGTASPPIAIPLGAAVNLDLAEAVDRPDRGA
jgi:hypothetical protein